MAKITVDGVVYDADPANNLLQECLSQGLDLPYFCWHPCMGSVGACRQCAVKQFRNADDTTGTVVMACMTPATDGAILSIKDPQAANFRAQVIESLMISHPHDCPVCEEGGECHLQDMTQMSGHNYRRYDFKKVTHRNQNLGPFIKHEMNRCIACYRCVRYYNDYAGGTDLAVLGSHHHVYFGRHEEGTLESEFSGNLVEVCPTGVFTDKTFSAHYSRKWDLQTAPSVCTGCGAGCNTTPGERYGSLRRVVNRYHHDLNGYFLCDRGRFGYDSNNSAQRMAGPSLVSQHDHEKGVRKTLSTQEALRQFEAMIAGAPGGQVIGIGSPRASLESNAALRDRVGAANFYGGIADAQQQCLQAVIALSREQGLHCPDLSTLERADCVLLINEDLTNTSPRHALALRQSTRNAADQLALQARIPLWQDAAVRELAQQARSPLFILSPQGTRLDDVASGTFLGGVQQQINLLAAIAAALDTTLPALSWLPEAQQSLAACIASALLAAAHPAIVSGISAGSPALVEAAAAVARALQRRRGEAAVDLCFTMPEANTMGLGLLLEEGGGTLTQALQRLAAGEADAVVVLENDLRLRTTPDAIDAALAGPAALVVIDHLHNDFNARAHLLLSASTAVEQDGTWVNNEGRAQTSYQVFQPERSIRAAWEWLTPVDALDPVLPSSASLLRALSQQSATFAALEGLQQLRTGMQLTMRHPRQLLRYSGRTAMQSHLHVHEDRQPHVDESPLAFSMEGLSLQKDASLLSAAWAPGWNSNQAISKFQNEINGELRQGCKGVQLLTRDRPCAEIRSALANVPEPGSSEVYFIEHIFGGEEISATSSAIAARAVGPYLCVDAATARTLGLAQHGTARIRAGARDAEVGVLIRQRIAPGCVGLYCGVELSRAAFADGFEISAVAGGNVLARSRAMFGALLVNDTAPGEG